MGTNGYYNSDGRLGDDMDGGMVFEGTGSGPPMKKTPKGSKRGRQSV